MFFFWLFVSTFRFPHRSFIGCRLSCQSSIFSIFYIHDLPSSSLFFLYRLLVGIFEAFPFILNALAKFQSSFRNVYFALFKVLFSFLFSPYFFSFSPYFLVFLPIPVSVVPSHSYFYFRFYLYSVSVIHIFHSSKMLSFYFYSSHYFRSLSMLRGRVGRVGRSHPKSTFVLFFVIFFSFLKNCVTAQALDISSASLHRSSPELTPFAQPNLLTGLLAPHGVEHLAQAYRNKVRGFQYRKKDNSNAKYQDKDCQG